MAHCSGDSAKIHIHSSMYWWQGQKSPPFFIVLVSLLNVICPVRVTPTPHHIAVECTFRQWKYYHFTKNGTVRKIKCRKWKHYHFTKNGTVRKIKCTMRVWGRRNCSLQRKRCISKTVWIQIRISVFICMFVLLYMRQRGRRKMSVNIETNKRTINLQEHPTYLFLLLFS